MIVALLFASFAAAACPARSADLDATLEKAEAAFAAMTAAGFRSAAEEAVAEAGCLTDRPAAATIARLHRVEGLAAFVDRDEERSQAAFSAARAIEPDYTFPDALVPEGTPAAQLYAAAVPMQDRGTLILPPHDGRVEFDGQQDSARPWYRPALVQVVRDDGIVIGSAYLWPRDTLPPYEVATRGPNRALLGIAGSSLLAVGAVYGANLAVHESYFDAHPDSPERERIRAANNALVVTGAALGVVALGSGVGAVIAGRW